MKTNTIKAQILDTFSDFSAIAKTADVKADVKGTAYRVNIKKGEVTCIRADRKAIWTPESEVDALAFIDTLVHPVAEKKIDAQPEETVKKESTPKKAKATRKVIDSKWIAHLVEEANKSPELQEEDEIRFRVATSHGKPVCAHVDLYTDGEKIATAGIHHRVGFAATGINQNWTDRVNTAIRSIYTRIGNGKMIKLNKAVVKVDGDKITSAEGSVADVLAIISNI